MLGASIAQLAESGMEASVLEEKQTVETALGPSMVELRIEKQSAVAAIMVGTSSKVGFDPKAMVDQRPLAKKPSSSPKQGFDLVDATVGGQAASASTPAAADLKQPGVSIFARQCHRSLSVELKDIFD